MRYDAVMDDLVRDDHAALNGIIRKVDDNFWSTYYPPNGWNCRCGVSQLMESEVTPGDLKKPVPSQKLDPIWQKNTGRDKQIWGKWLTQKDINAGTWKDNKLSSFDSLPVNSLPAAFDTANMSKQQLIMAMEEYLNDRTVITPSGIPAYLSRETAGKFSTKSISDIKGRFKYMNCIDDTLQTPDEIWAVENRCRFIKKFDKGVVLIADMEEGVLNYFNIIVSDKTKYLNAQRKGALLYKK